jgi:hypothetical protein
MTSSARHAAEIIESTLTDQRGVNIPSSPPPTVQPPRVLDADPKTVGNGPQKAQGAEERSRKMKPLR